MADNPPSRTVAGKYLLNPFIDPDLAREWYDLRKNGITNPTGGLEEYNPYPDRIMRIYDITERSIIRICHGNHGPWQNVQADCRGET